MIGCLLGLLLYNIYPARAFMGDTGSLAIGGSLSILAVIEKVEILIPILFSVYLLVYLEICPLAVLYSQLCYFPVQLVIWWLRSSCLAQTTTYTVKKAA